MSTQAGDDASVGRPSAAAAAAVTFAPSGASEQVARGDATTTPPPAVRRRRDSDNTAVDEEEFPVAGGQAKSDAGPPVPSFHDFLGASREDEFRSADERMHWCAAYETLKRRVREHHGDDVNETALKTPALETNPLSSDLPGSDARDGIHHVGASLGARTRARRVLIVGRNRWRVAIHAVLLGVMGADVQVVTEPRTAAAVAAPFHRPAEAPKKFDAIIYDADDDRPILASAKRGSRTGPLKFVRTSERSRHASIRSFGAPSPGSRSPQRGTSPPAATSGDPSDRAAASPTTAAAPTTHSTSGGSGEEAREPGEDVDLLAMLRQEEDFKKDPALRAARLAAAGLVGLSTGGSADLKRGLRAASDVADFCLNVRNSDAEFRARTNLVVRHTIISVVGQAVSGGEAISSGVDLYLRRPLAMHVRTLRRVLFPGHMSTRLRSQLIMAKPSFGRMLTLFSRTADAAAPEGSAIDAHGGYAAQHHMRGARPITPSTALDTVANDEDPDGDHDALATGRRHPSLLGDHLAPSASSSSSAATAAAAGGGDSSTAKKPVKVPMQELVSPLARQVIAQKKRGVDAADSGSVVVPVVDDVDKDELIEDLRKEVAAVKREADRRVAEGKDAVARQVEEIERLSQELTRTRMAVTAAESTSTATQNKLTVARKQLATLQEKYDREVHQLQLARLRGETLEASLGGAGVVSVDHLRRQVEHLTSELERERRLAVARSIRRGPATNDAQTQAGSGVTSSAIYRVANKDVALTCDIMSLAEYADAQADARDARQQLKGLQATLNQDTVALHEELTQRRAATEELTRQVEQFKVQIGAKAAETSRATHEVTLLKRKLSETTAQLQQLQQSSGGGSAAPSTSPPPTRGSSAGDASVGGDSSQAAEVQVKAMMSDADSVLFDTLQDLWEAAGLLASSSSSRKASAAGLPPPRRADANVDHKAYARELTRRMSSAAGPFDGSRSGLSPAAAGGGVPPATGGEGGGVASTPPLQRKSSLASNGSTKELPPLRGTPPQQSHRAPSLTTKQPAPFGERRGSKGL